MRSNVRIDVRHEAGCNILTLPSSDGMNRLQRRVISGLLPIVTELAEQPEPRPLIITGNSKFFSAGADLNEIAALRGTEAFAFSRFGQRLTQAVADFPALTIAAISGYCMGGGIDLALSCDIRIATPDAIFGHRGAALGILTGWGGTQRLPRLIGRGRALQMFLAAETVTGQQAYEIGLVNALVPDPVKAALEFASIVSGAQ